MRYRFLPRGYVEWLGLEVIPITLPRRRGYVHHVGGALPRPDAANWTYGVRFEGELYRSDPEGPGFIHLPTARRP